MARVSNYLNQKDWFQYVDGTGTAVFSDNGKSVVLDAPSSNRSFLLHYVVAFPGDSFEFSMLARNIETGKSESAEMFIDSPVGTRRDEVRIDNQTPAIKTLRYDVPLGASSPRAVVFGIGSDFATDGSGEFMLPTITKVKGDSSFMYATFKLAAGGGCTVHPTLNAFNIDDSTIIWNAGELRFDITPTDTSASLFLNVSDSFKPTLLSTADNGRSDSGFVGWNIGGLGNDGSFFIQAVNNAGVRLDLNAGLGRDLFVTVKLEV